MTEIDPRIVALSTFTGYDVEAYDVEDYTNGLEIVTDGGAQYLVMTEEEADQAVRESIRESLWAFRPDFLASETGLPEIIFTALAEEYEDANDAIRQLIGTDEDFDAFVNAAVSADSRGPFLAQYDHAEEEVGDFLVYRVN